MSTRAQEWKVLSHKIEREMADSGHYMLHHPSEMRILEGLSANSIRRLASRHRWLVQFHLHGDFIEFFRTVQAYY